MRKIFSILLICLLFTTDICMTSNAEDSLNSAQPTASQSSSEKSNRVKSADDIASQKDQNEKTDTSSKPDNNTTAAQDEDGGKTSQNDEENSDSNLPEVQSDSAILINSNTGMILYEKDAHKRMYPASTTKIVTAYIALQKLNLTDQVTASKTAISIPSDSSKMGILEGETLTVEELLYALMVQSANDAANVLAEAVSGSISEFVTLMNETARDLGMNDTNFANPHGYHDDNHYTTAYDMSIVAQEAMKNPVFAEIVSTKSVTIQPTNKYDKVRQFSTKNSLINQASSTTLRYQYANGIKTGYTDKAGQCLVGSAERSGMSLISVVFHAPKDVPDRAFIDTKNMFEYAYAKYQIKTVMTADELASTCNVKWAAGKSHLVLKTNGDVKALLPRENYDVNLLTSEINIYDDIVAPVAEGAELGEITYYYDKQEVIKAKLYASREVSRSYVKQFFSYVLNIWFLLILGIVVCVILLRRRKEKRRIARLRQMRKQQNRRGRYE